jgi:hypothetical protein
MADGDTSVGSRPETEDDLHSGKKAETLHWIDDFIGELKRGSRTYAILRNKETFCEEGRTHINLYALCSHVNRTFGGSISSSVLAQRLRVVGWKEVPALSATNDQGETLTSPSYWVEDITLAHDKPIENERAVGEVLEGLTLGLTPALTLVFTCLACFFACFCLSDLLRGKQHMAQLLGAKRHDVWRSCSQPHRGISYIEEKGRCYNT